jgi:Zn-dependent peptidase ImmA (M78 family)
VYHSDMPALARQLAPRRDPPWIRLAEDHADANALLRIFEVEYPPVDVERIAQRMGIEVVPETDPDVSGRIDVSRELLTATIRVRRDHVLWRQRFTIAHEIGHLLLGHTDESTTCFRGVRRFPS